ncbi:MAG: DUF72 domain-containing protein [Ignavibacteriae bacterium]|nr:DUF72 domain-containing protein [Ignavibacteriota bacterium]
MATNSVQYLVGVSGWEHESLSTCFYGAETEYSTLKLRYYARFFDTVEIRATFWDDELGERHAQEWIEAVAENKRFRFTVKLHKAFSHEKRFNPDAATRMRGLLHALQKNDRLGSLLVQLPYSFTNTSSNRFHLVKLGEVFRGFPMYVEFRHESWNQPNLITFLNENLLLPVHADLPRVSQLMPFVTRVIGNAAYVRLHGRNEKGWLTNEMDARYDYLYNPREVRELRRRIDFLAEKCAATGAGGRRVFIIFNNTTHGKAPANAFQMISALIDGKQITIPEATQLAFPDVMNTLNAAVDNGLFSQRKLYGKVG